MRVLIVDTYYPAFLAAHYAGRPHLAHASYDAQLAALLARHFGTGDAYSRVLRAHGHEAVDLVVNAPALQAAWAREHGVGVLGRVARLIGRLPGRPGELAREAYAHRIVAAQIKAFRPDVVYCQDLQYFFAAELSVLRRRGILVCGQIASKLPEDGRWRAFDLILTSFPHFVERLRREGIASEYLAIAFDDAGVRDLGVDTDPVRSRPRDVVFVGGVHPRVHPGGVRLVERLCETTDIEVWGYGADELPPESPIRARHRGQAWGREMYGLLASAKVVVNRHIEAAEGHANNMRLFEATGCGAALVTEAAPNLGELFEPGEEVATYRDENELVRVVGDLLADDERRLTLAAAGQRRTLTDHTYDRRIAELEQILERHLAARVRCAS